MFRSPACSGNQANGAQERTQAGMHTTREDPPLRNQQRRYNRLYLQFFPVYCCAPRRRQLCLLLLLALKPRPFIPSIFWTTLSTVVHLTGLLYDDRIDKRETSSFLFLRLPAPRQLAFCFHAETHSTLCTATHLQSFTPRSRYLSAGPSIRATSRTCFANMHWLIPPSARSEVNLWERLHAGSR